MLLNLVRLKYREPPEFMAIPSVTEQYSFAGSLGLSAGNLLDFGSSGIATDFGVSTSETPTISYIPLQDDEFNTRLLTPVSLDTVSLMTRTGWNFHRVLKLTVKNINNVDNATTAGGPTPQKKPEFEQFDQLCRLLRTLQERNEIEIIYATPSCGRARRHRGGRARRQQAWGGRQRRRSLVHHVTGSPQRRGEQESRRNKPGD